MRLLHIKGKNKDEYIVIDKIEKFVILKEKDTIVYSVHLIVSGGIIPLVLNTSEPRQIVTSLLTAINTIDNEIVEYTIKGEKNEC